MKQCIPPGFVLSCSDACMQADTVYDEAVVQVTTVSCRGLLQGLIDLQVGCPSRVQSVDLLLR